MMSLKECLIDKYGYNEPIYVSEILYKNYSRQWIFKELKKLVDTGEIKRFDTGIYYFSKKMPWGDSTINPRKVLERRFLSDGNSVYGYIAGASLLNQAGLSTQIPNLVELVTNNESTRVRDVTIGNQRIRARRSRTTVTKENVRTLQFLDLMNTIKPSSMDETELFMLTKYTRASGVTRASISQYGGLFPARAMKNIMESGAVYELA